MLVFAYSKEGIWYWSSLFVMILNVDYSKSVKWYSTSAGLTVIRAISAPKPALFMIGDIIFMLLGLPSNMKYQQL